MESERRYQDRSSANWRTLFRNHYLAQRAAPEACRDRLANAGETRFTAEAGTPRNEARAVFVGPTFEQETEFTGPVMLKLWISSTSDDADLFAIVRKIGRDGREVMLPGQNQPCAVSPPGCL